MRTIHYGICFVIVLVVTVLFYECVNFIFHLPFQLPVLIILLCTAVGVERLWALLKWMSPVIGRVDTKEEERTRTRIIEYELSRSLRYGSPLVMAAIREKVRTSAHVVAKNLRGTDIVLRIPTGYLLVIMPATTLEQGHIVMRRLNKLLSIQDVVMADEVMLQAAITLRKKDIRSEVRGITAEEFRIMCIQLFTEKLESVRTIETITDAPVIYNLIEVEPVLEPVPVPMREFTCPLPSLNEPEPEKRSRTTKLLKSIIMADSGTREA